MSLQVSGRGLQAVRFCDRAYPRSQCRRPCIAARGGGRLVESLEGLRFGRIENDLLAGAVGA